MAAITLLARKVPKLPPSKNMNLYEYVSIGTNSFGGIDSMLACVRNDDSTIHTMGTIVHSRKSRTKA